MIGILSQIPDLTFFQTANFEVKIGEIGLLAFICCIDIPKWFGILQLSFEKIW